MIISDDKKVLLSVSNNDVQTDGSFIVPVEVTIIGDYAFKDCSNLRIAFNSFIFL